MRLAILIAWLGILCQGQVGIPVTRMIAPSYGGTAKQISAINNQMKCAIIPWPNTVLSATRISFGTPAGSSNTCRVMLYEDADAGALLLSASNPCNNNVVTGTSSPVNIIAGTNYRLCECASSTTAQAYSVGDASPTNQTLWDVLNDGATRLAIAGNDCSSGIPSTPGTMGTPTAFSPPVIEIEQ